MSLNSNCIYDAKTKSEYLKWLVSNPVLAEGSNSDWIQNPTSYLDKNSDTD